ncbi:protein tyrosine phosphatase type IVA 1-like [Sarcoptes scabiei]|nr:protein tyrosine phosphatase type IVA 1-like [Sarcoptes scabiei]
MSIKDSHHSFIIGYTLESVSEQRQLHWAFEPYWDTESLNHSLKEMSSPPEDPWMIEVHPFDDVSPITSGLHDPDSPVNIIPKSYQVETIEEELESQTDQSSESIVTINEKECLKNGSKNTSGCEQFQKQNQIFKDQCIEMSVPGTMTIHTCHVCAGVMRKRCTSCTATGSMKCDACNGLGYFGAHHNKSNLVRSLGTESISDYCWKCQGRGRLRCDTCTGSGMMICVGCAGSGQIKCFIKMIVTLTNHQNSAFIRDPVSFEIPVKELKSVDGRIVLDEKGCDLKPSPFFDELIGKECRQLLRLHRIKLPANSRLILQRHRIKIISVHKFHCTWAGDKFRFYLIGQTPNLKCIAINYPQRFSLSALNHCRCCTLI